MTDFNILFPGNRAEGETELKLAQLVTLRMSRIIDYLCCKFNETYSINPPKLTIKIFL